MKNYQLAVLISQMWLMIDSIKPDTSNIYSSVFWIAISFILLYSESWCTRK